jgi:hypothetical protein
MVADISFALLARELAVGHRREPDVGVEPDLMAGMAGAHRAAARLRHVADQETAPAGLGALSDSRSRNCTRFGWPQLRLRERRITCQVAPLIGSATRRRDSPWHKSRWCAPPSWPASVLRPNKFLRRGGRILGMGKRRQRLRIDAASVLRCGVLRRPQQGGAQQRSSATPALRQRRMARSLSSSCSRHPK